MQVCPEAFRQLHSALDRNQLHMTYTRITMSPRDAGMFGGVLAVARRVGQESAAATSGTCQGGPLATRPQVPRVIPLRHRVVNMDEYLREMCEFFILSKDVTKRPQVSRVIPLRRRLFYIYVQRTRSVTSSVTSSVSSAIVMQNTAPPRK